MYEIRIHNRGGQGGKSASEMLAATAMAMGKEAQAFPEYGPERYGAPIKSYTRISEEKIKTVQPVVAPNLALVLDATLLDNPDITDGLNKDGILLINTKLTPEEIKEKAKGQFKIYAIDASGISLQIVGKDFPNMPMLGAAAKLSGKINLEILLEEVKNKFGKKMDETLVNKNLEVVKAGYNAVSNT